MKYDNARTDSDKQVEEVMKQKLAGQNYLTRDDFIKIGRWKSPRPTKYYESNSEALVKEISNIAFCTTNEELKIGILTLLKGCSYPVASVILHFKYPNHYPIIDFRALWSLRGIKPPNYTYEFWQKYVDDTRSIAGQLKVDIRTLDKALWKYSEEHQK